MTYDLAIGDRSYSSWSLRGWLLFEKFGIPVKCHTGVLYTDDFNRLLAEFAPARLVPAMRTPEGDVVGDTLAIAETLAERHPEAGIWPDDPGGAGDGALHGRRDAFRLHRAQGRLRHEPAPQLCGFRPPQRGARRPRADRVHLVPCT